MANYTKTTDFAAKDTLPGGDTNKVVRGSEFETEFDAISTAIATKSNTADPTFTGTGTIPTVDINAGAIDGTVIGANSAAAGTFTNLTATTADINAGTIDNAVIGGSTAAAGTFTNLVATTADINGGTVDGATIGGSSAGAGTFTNLTASGTVNFSGATVSNLGTITTANLDGGTADNIVIGGSTPAAGTFTNVVATTADINGGTADNVVIGGATPAAGTFSSLTATTADINGGTIDGVSIGSSSAGAGAFSTLTVGGASVLTSVVFSNLDAGAVTTSSKTFSNSDTQIPTNAAVKAHVEAVIPTLSVTESSVTAHQAALVLSASQTTSGTFADARIAESNVTQHQAALAITPSQIAGGTSPTFTATASGALANGDKVVLNTDGTVSVINGGDAGTGSKVNFNSGDTEVISAVFDSSNNKIVVVYRDSGASNHGTAIVGTISGTTISFGSEVVFNAATTIGTAIAFDSSNNKVVIAYTDSGNSNYGTAIVGTVSGTSISFGSAVVFNSGGSTTQLAAAFDSSNNKVVIAYRDAGNSDQGTAIVGTVSGTSISFGTAVVYETGDTRHNAATFDSSNNKVVIAFQDFDDGSQGMAVVGTVSGTSISFGSVAVFNTGNTDEISATFDSTNNKVVLCYKDIGNSSYGTAIVGTVSGTNISFGSEAVFKSASIGFVSVAFSSGASKCLIFYTSSSDQLAIEGTVSGTNISFGSELSIETSNSRDSVVAYDPNAEAFALFYKFDTSPVNGKSLVRKLEFTNLTSNNFIGISNAAYSNGATATIQIVGSIDDAQSSLVTGSDYYVRTDGTLNTTKGTPEVYAGKAISSTKLAIQHPELAAAGLTLISSVTDASNSSTIDLTGMSDSFGAYKVFISDLIPTSQSNMLLQIFDDGTIQTSSNLYFWRTSIAQGSMNVYNDNSDGHIEMVTSSTPAGPFTGEIMISRSKTAPHGFQYSLAAGNGISGNDARLYDGAGWFYTTDPTHGTERFNMTGIRIKMASGNIGARHIALYGVS